jgi:hypothetical protein
MDGTAAATPMRRMRLRVLTTSVSVVRDVPLLQSDVCHDLDAASATDVDLFREILIPWTSPWLATESVKRCQVIYPRPRGRSILDAIRQPRKLRQLGT